MPEKRQMAFALDAKNEAQRVRVTVYYSETDTDTFRLSATPRAIRAFEKGHVIATRIDVQGTAPQKAAITVTNGKPGSWSKKISDGKTGFYVVKGFEVTWE